MAAGDTLVGFTPCRPPVHEETSQTVVSPHAPELSLETKDNSFTKGKTMKKAATNLTLMEARMRTARRKAKTIPPVVAPPDPPTFCLEHCSRDHPGVRRTAGNEISAPAGRRNRIANDLCDHAGINDDDPDSGTEAKEVIYLSLTESDNSSIVEIRSCDIICYDVSTEGKELRGQSLSDVLFLQGNVSEANF
jgi:hypothetical protein